MNLRLFSAYTPTRRHTQLLNKSILAKKKPLKVATSRLQNCAGRNHSGQKTVWTKSCGNLRRFRKLSWGNTSQTGIIESLEYDPYRSAFICRVFDFTTNSHFYALAARTLTVGAYFSKARSITYGHTKPLRDFPVGAKIFSLFVSKCFMAGRSAGTFCRILKKQDSSVCVRLPSGEQRSVSSDALACFGTVSNEFACYVKKGKAGRSRWLRRSPKVRGVAMNPFDHPHGGGEGKTSGGGPSQTPWGKPAFGVNTSNSSTKLIVPRKHNV